MSRVWSKGSHGPRRPVAEVNDLLDVDRDLVVDPELILEAAQ
jgi:hypothetical protein